MMKELDAHNNRNKTIDMIRGLAIMMVFLVHYGQVFGNPRLTQFGQMGCQIFFFVSGYTCSFSYKKTSVISFYWKRFLSIVLGYYPMLILVVVINIVVKYCFNSIFVGGGNTEGGAIICNFLLINGFIPSCNNNVFPGAWFIGTIIILYVLHPILDGFYRLLYNPLLATIILIAFMVIVGILVNIFCCGDYNITNNSFTYYFFFNQASCYILGMYLYKEEKREYSLLSVILLAGLFLVISVFVFYSDLPLRFSVIILLVGLFSYYLYFVIKGINKTNKYFALIGENSFYIFLTHTIIVWPVNKIIRNVFISQTNNCVLFGILLIPSFVLVVLLSYILKRLVLLEKKMLDKSHLFNAF